MAITSGSTVEFRAEGTTEWTVVSDAPVGVAAYSYSNTARQRAIPSIAPILATQQLQVRDARFGITIDDNPITHPLLFMRSGARFDVRLRREGVGAGKPQVVMSGPATINLTNAAGGVRTFTFNVQTTDVDDTGQ